MKALVIVHVSCEGPGLFEPMLAERGVDVQIVDLERGDALPGNLTGIDLLIVMGGPMNVGEEDRYPFLNHEYALLREAMAKDLPVLGVCLGCQILAAAAGARVYRGKVEEFGWSRVELTQEGCGDPLFVGVDPSMLVFQWHGYTFDLPEGGELLGTSAIVPAQAFRVGRRAYGLQYHIEMDRRLLDLWMEVAPEERDDLDAVAVERIVQEFDANEDALNAQAAAIARNFYRIATQL